MSGSSTVDNTINRTLRRRRWLFVLNNPEDHSEINFINDCIKCWCYQYEIGEKGTPHYQGYFELRNQQRVSWIKKNMSKEMHLEACFGDRNANIHYCSKPHGPNDNCYDKCIEECICKKCIDARKCPLKITDIIFGGDWSEEQGKRNDINCFKDAINEGMSVKDLWINHFALMLRYRDMVIKMRNDINDSYYEGLRSVYLIFGESGTSKSKMIRDEEVNIYDKALDSKDKDWWEGYNQQQVVHFEDFEGEIPMRECIRLCDRYKIGVAKRYIGTVPFDGRIIYFSSNKIPEEWFNKELDKERFNAFYRRIRYYVMTKRGWDKPLITECLLEFQGYLNEYYEEKFQLTKANVCFCNTCKNK